MCIAGLSDENSVGSCKLTKTEPRKLLCCRSIVINFNSNINIICIHSCVFNNFKILFMLTPIFCQSYLPHKTIVKKLELE